jgi:hypothetical protein
LQISLAAAAAAAAAIVVITDCMKLKERSLENFQWYNVRQEV